MNINLKLLSMRFFQTPEEPAISAEGVNPYLLEHVLKPYLREEKLHYGDLDYEAFEADDLRPFINYYETLYPVASKLEQFTCTIAATCPDALKLRQFC